MKVGRKERVAAADGIFPVRKSFSSVRVRARSSVILSPSPDLGSRTAESEAPSIIFSVGHYVTSLTARTRPLQALLVSVTVLGNQKRVTVSDSCSIQ